MTQLIFELNNVATDDGYIGGAPVEETLHEVLSQQGIDYTGLHLQGTAALVDFKSPEDAKIAFQSLNGMEFMGSHIRVGYGRSDPNARGGHGRDRSNGPRGDRRRSSRRNNGRNNQPPTQQIEQYPCRILIPTKMIKVVLGKGGNTIQGIQQRTNTKIDVHRERNKGANETITTIKGSPINFSKACREILTVLEDELNKNPDINDRKPLQLKVLAHDSLCGRVIGREGKNLKHVKQESGAKIIISNTMFEEFSPLPFGMDPSFSSERVITMEGSVDCICKAEEEISKKLRHCLDRDTKTLKNSGMYPPGMLNYFQGMPPYMMSSRSPYGMPGNMGYSPMGNYPGGGLMNNYPGLLGNYPHYQQPSGYSSGPPQQHNTIDHISISIPTRAVGAMIGRKGGYINNMKVYSQAQVRVIKGEEGGESKVEINGPPDAQYKASLCVFNKIKESLRSSLYDAELKTEVLVPGNCLGRIIGKKGQVVQGIQESCGTEIEVPKDKQGGTKAPVYIKGTFTGTQSAISRIRDIVGRALQQENMK